MIKVDVIVLGGGPGGYLAAERAAQGGKMVALVENRSLGGVCLNEGCIPSKTYLNSAKIYDYARASEGYGVTTKEATLNHKQILKRKENVVQTLVGGVTAKLKGCGVQVIFGKGAIQEKTKDGIVVTVTATGAILEDEVVLVGDKVIIATGSTPIIPPIPGLREGVSSGFVLTSREIFELEEIPKSLVIIGGGVIGLEMASYFASAGTTVTVIEMENTIIPAFDKDISNALFKELKTKGITFLLSSQVVSVNHKKEAEEITEGTKATEVTEVTEVTESTERMEVIGGTEGTDRTEVIEGTEVTEVKEVTEGIKGTESTEGIKGTKGTVIYDKGEETFEIATDCVLCAIGRKPAIEGIGLEKVNIYTEKGAIVTDDHMQTNVSGIYAVGDVNGKYMLAHTAYREAEVAVNHILGKKDFMRYEAVPSVIYTYPEVACVGKTMEQATAAGMTVRCVTTSFKYSGRYLAEVDKGNGFCKIIVDTKKNCIVGIHMIGSYVSEMVYGVTYMIEAQTPIDQIKETIFPHPTVSEVIREAMYEL